MENIRVFEEGGYIHFILRPEADAAALLGTVDDRLFLRLWTAG